MDYYVDFEKSDQLTYYRGYLYGNILGTNRTAGTGVQTTVKSERITFIPPRSSIGSKKFKLTTGTYELVDPTIEKVPKSWRPNSKKLVKIKKLDFPDPADSPEQFRNFLTFSTSEKFETEFYIENGFWIGQILEMKRLQFLGPSRDGNFYRQANRFYNYSDEYPDPEVNK